jgi:hypothetical protein
LTDSHGDEDGAPDGSSVVIPRVASNDVVSFGLAMVITTSGGEGEGNESDEDQDLVDDSSHGIPAWRLRELNGSTQAIGDSNYPHQKSYLSAETDLQTAFKWRLPSHRAVLIDVF